MKAINKYIVLLVIAAMSFSITSCNYLDKEPENTIPTEQVDYSDLDNMYQPVSGMYAKLRTSGMHWVIIELTLIREQGVFSGQYNGSDYDKVNNYSYNDSFWGINEIWMQYYNMIKCANSAIASLHNYAKYCTTDELAQKNRAYQGEVRILRAYAYWRLVEAFGPCTILLDNNQTDMHRSTAESVLNYALKDLQYAIENCRYVRPNESPDGHLGAATAYTAMALAAKINCFLGNFTEVKALTDKIIISGKFELYKDYYQLWKIPGKLCDESLLECQCTDFGNGSGELIDTDQWFNCQGPNTVGSLCADGSAWANGWGDIGITTEFREWAAARGETVRATTSFLLAGEYTPDGDYIGPQTNPVNTDCWNGKVYTPTTQLTDGRTKYGTNNNVRILRYADVLLMNAEAKVMLGENGDEPFNLVRERAQMPPITGVTLQDIKDERRMEFVCEWGDNYTDLRRWGDCEAVLGELGWTEEAEYFPVPFSQYTASYGDYLLLEPVEEDVDLVD